jgi:LacI family transcriptional regulator
MPGVKGIALIYDATLAYDLKVMTGVAAYIQQNPNHTIYIEENALKDQRLPDLRHWRGDGIIANFDNPAIASAVARSKFPIVAFGGGYGYAHKSSAPYFFANNTMIANMAADHLLARGFRHFAYCGYTKTRINGWSEERRRAFVNCVRKRGFACDVYVDHLERDRQWTSVQRKVANWLKSLPKPLGVMAANDRGARHVLEACRALSLRAPEDVAVIGVDNDELLCELSSPALTSIEQGAKRLGYQAAALLDHMMNGVRPRTRRFVVDPVGVVTRQSTDVLAVDDPIVSNALRFIREHAFEGIKVQDIVNAVAVSRSGLEAKIKKALGYTAHTAIRKAQLEQARRLVSETNLPLKEVAANVGFRSIQHMTTLFGKVFHQPPAKYRQAIRVV